MAEIPADWESAMDVLDFEPQELQRLFDRGYSLAEEGYSWLRHPPSLDPDEMPAG